MKATLLRVAAWMSALLLLTVGGASAQPGSPFTVLSNNADTANDYLFVELMYEKSACRDYEARFFRTNRNNPNDSVPVKIVAFLNNLNTFETDADSMSLKRPTAGGYRLKFELPNVPNPADSGYRICVKSYTLAYKCVGCAAGGSDAIFADADIAPDCPYTGSDLLACYRRESREGNWEAWIQDERDCQPYRIVAMPDGRWWMAQNINYQKDLTMYAGAKQGPTAAPTVADAGFWCPSGKSFTNSNVTYSGVWSSVVTPEPTNYDSISGGTIACKTYGALYTWTTANSLNGRGALSAQPSALQHSTAQGICPVGWLMPSDYDWGLLFNSVENCADPYAVDGAAPCDHIRSGSANGLFGSQNLKALLKSTISCPPHTAMYDSICAKSNRAAWNWHRADYAGKIAAPLALGNDRYGFTLVPAGIRYQSTNTGFYEVGTRAHFWTANAPSAASGHHRTIINNDGLTERWSGQKQSGQSVRCVKAGDNAVGFVMYPRGTGALTMTTNTAALSFSCTNLTPKADYTYEWTLSGGAGLKLIATTNNAMLQNNSATAGQSYTLTVQAKKSGAVVYTASREIDITATPPVVLPSLGLAGIYVAPESESDRGVTVKLSVYSAKMPTGVSYQWIATPITAGAPVWNLGTTSTPSYTTTSPNISAESNYEISVVMRAPGYQDATASIDFKVRGCNAIRQDALAVPSTTLCVGTAYPIDFGAATGGDNNYSYQWQARMGSMGTWADIPGATMQAYTGSAPAANSESNAYRRIATSCANGVSNTSPEVVVTSYKSVEQVTISVASTCSASTVALNLNNPSGGNNVWTYQWKISTDNGINFINYTGTGNKDRNLNVTSPAVGVVHYYQREVTSCGQTHLSTPIAVASMESGRTVQTVSSTLLQSCANAAVIMPAITNTAATPTYWRWQSSPNNSTWTDFTACVGANKATCERCTIPANTYAANAVMYFRRGVANCNTTITNWSSVITVRYNGGAFTDATMPSTKKVCTGVNVLLDPALPTGGTGTYTYLWQVSTDGTTYATAPGTSNQYQYTFPAANNTAGTRYFRRQTTKTNCSSTNVVDGVPIIVVSGTSIEQNALADQTACPDESVTFDPGVATVTGVAAAVTYQWQAFNAGTNTWSNIGSATDTTYTTTAPSVGGKSTTSYRRMASVAGCGSVTSNAAVATALSGNATVGNLKVKYIVGANVPVTLAPAVNGTGTLAYQWQQSDDSIKWNDISGATGQSYTTTPTIEGYLSPFYRLKVAPACGVPVYSSGGRIFVPLGCPYFGKDLIDETCVERTAGANNWEAQIKDARDGRTYRIVLMPGGQWWFAQNLAHKSGEYLYANPDANHWSDPSTYEILGLQYPWYNQPCPLGWRPPEWETDWVPMLNGVDNGRTRFLTTFVDGRDVVYDQSVTKKLTSASSNPAWTAPTDDYGFSMLRGGAGDRYITDGWTVFRASSEKGLNLFVGTAGQFRQHSQRGDSPMRICCGNAGSYVRCVQDTATTPRSAAPVSLTADYISVTSGGSTTLRVKGGKHAAGAVYQWGTGSVGNNILNNEVADTLARTLTATTTYWVRRVDTDGTPTDGLTLQIAVAACPYTGADRTRLTDCRQRGEGEQNWEAYMLDSRTGENKTYRIVYMPDSKWWTAQNLNYQTGLTYATGASQPNITGGDPAGVAPTGLERVFWCPGATHPHSVISGGQASCNTYGALYSWRTLMALNGTGAIAATSSTNPSGVQGICPPNWHVPSGIEWDIMLDCVEGNCNSGMHESAYQQWVGNASVKLRSKGYGIATPTEPLWAWSNESTGEDAYGFTVLPAGYRSTTSFYDLGYYDFMASSTQRKNSVNYSEVKYFHHGRPSVYANRALDKYHGTSVRCVYNTSGGAFTPIAPSKIQAKYTLTGSGVTNTLVAVGALVPTGGTYQWGTGVTVGSNLIAGATQSISHTPTTATDSIVTYWVRVSSGGTFSDAAFIKIRVTSNTECSYKGPDILTGSATLRTTQAKNWEARITDSRDGKVYRIAQMPSGRWWFAQNLNYTLGLTNGGNGNTGGIANTADPVNIQGYYWCVGAENSNTTGGAAACNKWGALYPWRTAMSMDGNGTLATPQDNDREFVYRGVCPMGWHVPTDIEMRDLVNCAEGNCDDDIYTPAVNGYAGNQVTVALKSDDIWPYSNSGTTSGQDYYGFSLLPTGYRSTDGKFYGLNTYTFVWNSKASGPYGYDIHFRYDRADVRSQTLDNKGHAWSVRCVSDGEWVEPSATTAPTSIEATAIAVATGGATPTTLTAIGGTMEPTATFQWGTSATVGSNILGGAQYTGASITVKPTATTTYWVRRVKPDGTFTTGATRAITVAACPTTLPSGLIAGTCMQRPSDSRWVARIRDARDSKEYSVIRVGANWWMGEMLKYGACTTQATIPAGLTGGGCLVCSGVWHYEHSTGRAGAAAVNDANASAMQGICPAGWRLPGVQQAMTLLNGVISAKDFGANEVAPCSYAEYVSSVANGGMCIGNNNWHYMNTGGGLFHFTNGYINYENSATGNVINSTTNAAWIAIRCVHP